MGEQPDGYWDHREARWVRYVGEPVAVPPQAEPIEHEPVVSGAEADVRSG